MNDYTHTDRLKRKFLKKSKLAIISITNKCNLNCIYCRPVSSSTWYDKLSSKEKDSDNINELVWDKLLADDIEEVLISGGEPFSSKALTPIAARLHNAGKNIAIHTNGLHKKSIQRLHEITSIGIRPNIHLSSELTPELQYKLRGCSMPYSFIKAAVYQYNCPVELKVIIHSKTPCDANILVNILSKWMGLGVVSIRFQPIVQTGSVPTELALSSSDIIIFEEIINLKRTPMFNSFIRNSTDSLQLAIDVIRSPVGHLTKSCNMFEKIELISSSGEVLNCASAWGKDARFCNKKYDLTCCGFCM
ncbi:radical SAM protein [Aeromonas veronii]|uniref:radical SAM protein n=1 Tax=Aeromonas veronii TaxID=654 RepID=UPI001116DA17|nr:radical SAM protein [Aeromonas veronii]TNI04356.1 hypothetical protein CF135_15765 [Aeromonas veronii]HDO1312616.1 radical SAM protein [Aeromonas veronii]